MATELTNDKGATESKPFEWFAGAGDLSSWGRVHKSIRDSVVGVLESSDGQLPNGPEAGAWAEASEKYASLAVPGLGFEMLYDFGTDAIDQEGILLETIASAKEGQRLLGILRQQSGIEGGDDSAGAEHSPLPPTDTSMFVSGAVVAGLLGVAGFAYWKLKD